MSFFDDHIIISDMSSMFKSKRKRSEKRRKKSDR